MARQLCDDHYRRPSAPKGAPMGNSTFAAVAKVAMPRQAFLAQAVHQPLAATLKPGNNEQAPLLAVKN